MTIHWIKVALQLRKCYYIGVLLLFSQWSQLKYSPLYATFYLFIHFEKIEYFLYIWDKLYIKVCIKRLRGWALSESSLQYSTYHSDNTLIPDSQCIMSISDAIIILSYCNVLIMPHKQYFKLRVSKETYHEYNY